ncbi:sensor histidine kinase [Natronincola peptidivorans]|uniref:sensor histidine kinase n=1 Tax=Natronincola peptidivorans TaxID=426128 RepID=UPI001481BBCB|nr:PAS domain-containing sensor histidine kinase [Natronincola peptidivorans]
MEKNIDWKNMIAERELMGAILNKISEGIAVLDQEGRFIMMNDAYSQMLSYEGRVLEDAMNSYDLEKNNAYININEFIIGKVREGISFDDEICTISSKGERKHICFSCKPICNEEGEAIYTVVCLHEMTKLMLQSEKIQQQKEYINNIIQALPTPVAVVAYPGCTYEFVNKEYVEFLKAMTRKALDHNDIIGSTISEILPLACADAIKGILGKIYKEPMTTQEKMISFKTPKGEAKHYQMLHTALKYSANDKMYIVRIGMDITSQVVLLENTEALTKAKEEFFATISHELRSPIAVMHSIFQMLNDDYYKRELNEKTRKLLKKAQRNNRKLLRLVNNFLDITKAEAGFMQLRQVNANLVKYTQYLVKTILPVVEKKKIQLNFTSTCSTKRIVLDIEKYERILLNLLSNAVKYTQYEGKIDVYIHEDDRYLKVGVKDNGSGISEEEIDKIFDRFYISCSSEKKLNEGTGIGLSLVKRFMQLMEGKIEVNSHPGEGSEFILSFPKKLKNTTEYTMIEELQPTRESISLEFSVLYD